MIKKKLVFMSSLLTIIYTSTNHVNFISFDNDDMKPSKRQFTFLSLISGLNHNINKQNLAKFGFALSLQKPIKGPLHRRGRLWSQLNFTEFSLKFSNYELRTLFNEAKCGLRTTPRVTVIRRIKSKIFLCQKQGSYIYEHSWAKLPLKAEWRGIKWFSHAEAE